MAAQEPSGVVDFGYLEGFAAGDSTVIREVLALFIQQAALWSGSLDAVDPAWRDVAHTIKGAARGIGADRLGDICARAEADGAHELPAVRAALAATLADVRAYLARQG
jgi:HPt (histidine-containing phosphotransfer) domain-containing protein